MKVLPARLVDRLPVDWWRPGNLHRFGPIEVHFCDDDLVRTIHINQWTFAQGSELFPYGEWDT